MPSSQLDEFGVWNTSGVFPGGTESSGEKLNGAYFSELKHVNFYFLFSFLSLSVFPLDLAVTVELLFLPRVTCAALDLAVHGALNVCAIVSVCLNKKFFITPRIGIKFVSVDR